MADLYRYNDNSSSPARNALAVTPSDTQDMALATKAIYIGTAGDVTVIMLDNTTTITFKSVGAGFYTSRSCHPHHGDGHDRCKLGGATVIGLGLSITQIATRIIAAIFGNS